MRLLILITSLISFCGFAQADSDPSKIIRASFSEIESVEIEWCAASYSETEICYAVARTFFAKSIRAIVFKHGLQTHTYIDSDFRGIDLFRLEFDLVGPIESANAHEIGKVSLFVDANAEVIAFDGNLPSVGAFAGARPRGR